MVLAAVPPGEVVVAEELRGEYVEVGIGQCERVSE